MNWKYTKSFLILLIVLVDILLVRFCYDYYMAREFTARETAEDAVAVLQAGDIEVSADLLAVRADSAPTRRCAYTREDYARLVFGILCGKDADGFFLLPDGIRAVTADVDAARLGYDFSLEFVAAEMLLGPFAPLSALLASLMIQARHLFYGVAMLEKFKGMGLRKVYMIFALTDETYALLSAAQAPAGVDEHDYFFSIALLDHIYWIAGSLLGSVLGSALGFDTTGVDFAMTALFLVIAVGQWRAAGSHIPALLGGAATVISLLLVGQAQMLLPALGVIVLVLTLMRSRLDGVPGAKKKEALSDA